MSITVITSCSHCGRKFEERSNKRKYGPAKVICRGCGSFMLTNLSSWKAEPLWKRRSMIAIRICAILSPLVFYFLSSTEFLKKLLLGMGVLETEVGNALGLGWVCFIFAALYGLASLIRLLRDIRHSDGETPTW